MNSDPFTKQVTKIVFSDEARAKLYEGLKKAADAVGCTLGPKGRTVLIQQNGQPVSTKDGVSVAKAIKLRDPIQRMGAELVLEAASKTNDVAGDGTTTATVLTMAMVQEGLKLLTAGYSPQELCRGINSAVACIIERLKDDARQVTTSSEVTQIGTISANGDANIGALIAQAMDKVGRDGIITVEDAKGISTTLEIVEGMQLDRGYLSPYFVTNPERMIATYEDAFIMVTDKKLSSLRELVPMLEAVNRAQRPLLIIADDVEGEALQALVINRVKGVLPVVAIKAPGYGRQRDEMLADICVMTGAKLVSSMTGLALEKMTITDLGRCKRIVVDAKSTTLVGSGATKDDVDTHVADLRAQLVDITLGADDVIRLKTRIAKLASGVAVVKVGGATELEMNERKYRIEDALHATRAAAEEGIVPGGGMALLDAAWMSDANKSVSTSNKGEQLGAEIVFKACQAPLRKIVANAGLSPDVVLASLNRGRFMSDIQYRGYDASNDKEVDMFVNGIIDPVKVTRTALQNAASVAIAFLSLDAVICEEDAEEEK